MIIKRQHVCVSVCCVGGWSGGSVSVCTVFEMVCVLHSSAAGVLVVLESTELSGVFRYIKSLLKRLVAVSRTVVTSQLHGHMGCGAVGACLHRCEAHLRGQVARVTP